MSFIGQSVYQQSLLSDADARLDGLDANVASRVLQTVYNAKLALVDAQDALHSAELATKLPTATHEARVLAVDASLSALQSADSALASRATALEGRATALESDIAVRVQSEIDAKVATVVFDALASELRNADSALSQSLATKVAQTVQTEVDEAQNALINSKVAQSAYDAKVALLDAKDAEHDTAIASKVDQSVYNAKMSALDASDALHSADIATKVAQSAYDAKVALLDAKDAEHEAQIALLASSADVNASIASLEADVSALEGADALLQSRATALEGRATALESDIAGRVQTEIDAKVSQLVFNALADELRNADSALSQSLATKVAQTVQTDVDEAQNALINSKVAQSAYDAKVALLDAKDLEHDSAIASKVAQSAYNAKVALLDAKDAEQDTAIASLLSRVSALETLVGTKLPTATFTAKTSALEEYVQVNLKTYTITDASGNVYAYNGSFQSLLPPPAPTALVATAGNAEVSLAFSAPVISDSSIAPISNYQYQLNDGAWVARSPASTASPLVISGLTNGASYSIKLRAVNSAGAGTASSAVSIALPNTSSSFDPNNPKIHHRVHAGVAITFTQRSATVLKIKIDDKNWVSSAGWIMFTPTSGVRNVDFNSANEYFVQVSSDYWETGFMGMLSYPTITSWSQYYTGIFTSSVSPATNFTSTPSSLFDGGGNRISAPLVADPLA